MIQSILERYPVGELLTRGVLLVDDELPNLSVLQSFLGEDYRVLTAESGAEALRIAETVPLDVVVTDQRMPEMTGVELLKRLRVLKPDLAGIALTGFGDTAALLGAINQARVFRFLKKPWEIDEVREAVRQASEHVLQQRTIARLVELLAARTDELTAALAHLSQTQQNMLHLDRLATTGRLAASITHDLRNSMTGCSTSRTRSARGRWTRTSPTRCGSASPGSRTCSTRWRRCTSSPRRSGSTCR